MNSYEPIAIVLAAIIAAIVSLLTIVASMFTVVLTNRLGSIAKEKEIKLQNYHKDRIEAVKTLYGLIVDLNFASNKLVSTRNTDCTHSMYKSIIHNWLVAFKRVYVYYSKNKILLLENNDLSNQVRSSLDKLSPMLRAVRKENNELDELEEHYSGQLAYNYYDSEIDEVDKVRKRLGKLIDNIDASDMAISFLVIRGNLEAYFLELIK